MGERGSHAVPVFDLSDPMGNSTCVTCGECVQACPTGALYEKTLMDDEGKTRVIQEFDKVVDSVCPFCGVGCQKQWRSRITRLFKWMAAMAQPMRTVSALRVGLAMIM